MATDMTVATTILEQLGGRRFIAMTGARSFVGDESKLMFAIPKTDRGINKVVVELTPLDVYDVTFYRIDVRKHAVDEIEKVAGVYCDQLAPVFERATGLLTRM